VAFRMKAIPVVDPKDCPKALVPLFRDTVAAGFPSPAEDYIERQLDFNELMISNPAATFVLRAEGLSMIESGISDGSYLVVDRSHTAQHRNIVIAALDGEYVVKQLQTTPGFALKSMNGEYADVIPTSEQEIEIFGVVTWVVRPMV